MECFVDEKILSVLLSVLVGVSCLTPAFTVIGATDTDNLDIEACTCGTSGVLHDRSCSMHVESISNEEMTYSSDPLTVEDLESIHHNKQLLTDENGNWGLQLEAWTEGSLTNEPIEIALFVDQSGSMYQAVDGAGSYMTYEEFIVRDNAEERERATTNPGYFMVVTENIRYDTGSTVKNRNNVVDSDYKYATALVRWLLLCANLVF